MNNNKHDFIKRFNNFYLSLINRVVKHGMNKHEFFLTIAEKIRVEKLKENSVEKIN
jgi:hypothetical protein